MKDIPITLCLFTSTKGHWGIKDRYKQTVEHFEKLLPLSNFGGLVAHIKGSSGDSVAASEMGGWLQSKGFRVLFSMGEWDHQSNSHQTEYIKDMQKVYSDVQVQMKPYVMHLEDDWLVEPVNGTLEAYLAMSTLVLDTNPDINQVRFVRFGNELARINGLKEKHNIDGSATLEKNMRIFTHNDWSNNPFIARSRDLRNALLFMKKNPNTVPQHSEHGLGALMKFFSYAKEPFASFLSSEIKVCHIGTKPGEEDILGKNLNSD